MKLSENFTLQELTRSQAATRHNIDNIPGPVELENLKALVTNILQPLRDMLQKPINVSSGYRSPELNEIIRGAKESQHMHGQAADIECFGVNNYALAKTIYDHFVYDQLILEFYSPETGGPNSGWIHVSYVRIGENRGDTLRARKVEGKTKYSELQF